MRKTLLSLFLLCLVYFPKAQHKLPSLDFTPLSPSAAAFTRYGDIPVDLSTGVPNISVPIYSLNAHGITVPISLSYHASGIKVQDVSSAVGLGWSLNAGGVITRTVLGWADELISDEAHLYRPRWRNAADFEYWGDTYAMSNGRFDAGYSLYYTDLNKSNYDYYSDRFYYNLGTGQSGIFRKDFETGDIRMMPYRPLKVNLNLVYSNGSIVITGEDGTVYYFKGHWDQWNLSKIVNSNKTDSVMFYSHIESAAYLSLNDKSYFSAHNTLTSLRTEGELMSTGDDRDCYRMVQTPKFSETYPGISSGTEEVVLMDSIVSSNAVVRFSYQLDRIDYRLYEGGGPRSRLTKIEVFNKAHNISVKEVNFTQSYFGTADPLTKRLRLDNVQVGAGKEEKYTFGYNSETLPHYSTGSNFYNEDFWGYYNGLNENPTTQYYEFTPQGVVKLFPDERYAKAGILEEIKYPTGGKTFFEYESNRVNRSIYGYGFSSPFVPEDGKVGGLRVRKISSYAYDGAVPQVKAYTYEIDLSNYFNRELNVNKFAFTQKTWWNYEIDNFHSECVGLDNWFFTYRNINYARPSGFIIGTSEAPLVYSRVTEYNGDENINTGKTVYSYDAPPPIDQAHFPDEPRFQGQYWRDWGNYEPRLGQKDEYKNENGIYKLVRKTATSYTVINEQAFHTGFNLESDLNFVDLTPGGFDHAFDHFNNEIQNLGLAEFYYPSMHFSDCMGYTGLHLPATTEVYDYVDNANAVKTTTSYEYNEYGQQIAANVTTSRGDVLKTKFTYPVDYPGQAPYNTMVERNNISPVIEQSTYKNTTDNFLQSTKTNYNYWDYATQTWGNNTSNQILPQTVETKKGLNFGETRIRYFNYDGSDNPLYVAKENDTRQLYIWGYNKTVPIAHVLNVPESERANIAYTSFEDESTGNWAISGYYYVTSISNNATGNRCLSLGGGTTLSRPLSPATNYILSYWISLNTTIVVSGNSTILTTSAPKNGWVFVKRRITGASTVSITGSGYLDEVRLYPESAQMNTITYEPLVGMTAQCDVNDRIMYYSYDASGRLTLVKDDDGNVLKKICYNFQGQPDACGDNVVPLWQATGATRCKPCPQNSNYITNIQQREEKDNNANSETYGNTRWLDIGATGSCVIQPDWQNTANIRCITSNNQNTGQQERQQTDANPCSGSYGQTRWVSIGINTTACPLPIVFRSAAINRNYYRQNCGPQQIPLPYLVNLPEGAYTSTNKAAEADALAEQEAQRLANVNGGCATIYIRITRENLDPTDGREAYEDIVFRFYADAAGTIPVYLPYPIVVNYKYHSWEVMDGAIEFENREVMNFTANSTTEWRFTRYWLYGCPGDDWCIHQDIEGLAPGRYVIIP